MNSVSFCAQAGQILGLLGPNGAGKSTLMHIICGLASADSGSASLFGAVYRDLDAPVRRVGTLLNPDWIDRRMTCREILEIQADQLRLPQPSRSARRMLKQVSLRSAADKRVAKLSLGMRQRLALGVALIGSPDLLILDEPINGLDADGVIWVRSVLKTFAQHGGTVLLSSHLMDEVEHTATHVAVLNHGVIVANDSVETLKNRGKTSLFIPASGEAAKPLLDELARRNMAVSYDQPTGTYTVQGIEPEELFHYAASNAVPLSFLSKQRQSLESIYFDYLRNDDESSAHHDSRS
ncbi:MAG: ABC transporter ATP-binding protein [Bifidobacterium tibiigranuli]|uniref:ABC transporter ATP-binding protein n=1 Tax=Bifidobacterium tibiigranuli TaxID=2172043 RepID=UPI002355DFD3|nr:ABC transporter ATP-binding protein [Bifidobacterium tibiigranuli]MCH3974607.1 ABC transporter ATP-binding protein [Bifidobacterium tibiigranuli]MCH4189527.1 ABC transporter ATP-binding protein [Bifidobacterium tibiigranuli]MCH4204349.1 ABC transporter ATP-binding protein [Bifidobacterium tibiigranuli]MCH4275396.1 ABC transporter ATP-binding protein [Bifidobacterium tibiigranuli]MCI1791601.1 ABC transporter ATP-binding protein [Bifidobacterium tibiigranuli]